MFLTLLFICLFPFIIDRHGIYLRVWLGVGGSAGETVLLLRDVPNYAHDQITMVDEAVLRVWLLFAIVEEDPDLNELAMR